MHELMIRLNENKPKLEKVTYEMFTEQMISTVILLFSDGESVAISVDGDTDEVTIAETPPNEDPLMDASTRSPWCDAIGKPIFAAWEMENHQGYHDGLQLDSEKQSVISTARSSSKVSRHVLTSRWSSTSDAGQASAEWHRRGHSRAPKKGE